jgi:hypothetical protein
MRLGAGAGAGGRCAERPGGGNRDRVRREAGTSVCQSRQAAVNRRAMSWRSRSVETPPLESLRGGGRRASAKYAPIARGAEAGGPRAGRGRGRAGAQSLRSGRGRGPGDGLRPRARGRAEAWPCGSRHGCGLRGLAHLAIDGCAVPQGRPSALGGTGGQWAGGANDHAQAWC